MHLPSQLFEVAWQLDRRRASLVRAVRHGLGMARAPRILPYRGFGTRDRVCVRARVVERVEVRPPTEQRTVLASAIASYRRYATFEHAGVPVRACWGDDVFAGVTDDEGFVEMWVAPPESATEGWNDVRLELEERHGRARAEARVHVCSPRARFAVISDVDDTVIDTGVQDLVRRARALFLSDSEARVPFEGVGAFYDALRTGVSGEEDNPIVYVSSSPYNLYEHLDELLAVHSIPEGAMLLRDWGLSRTGFAPGGGHGHKLAKIRLVMRALPALPFVLVGDSGQEDPELYVAIARESPERVRGIYIRDVTATAQRRAQLDALAATAREAGAVLVHVPDTVTAARHAAAQGWIEWREVDEVRARREEDTTAPS